MTVGHTALVLGDQLSHGNPALQGAGRVLLIESRVALDRLRYHRQRRHLVLSSMRHFAAELRERGDVEVVERRDVRRMADVLGKFDGVGSAKRSAVLAAAFVIAPPAAEKPAAAAAKPAGKPAAKPKK